jgi:hypothetical protein
MGSDPIAAGGVGGHQADHAEAEGEQDKVEHG